MRVPADVLHRAAGAGDACAQARECAGGMVIVEPTAHAGRASTVEACVHREVSVMDPRPSPEHDRIRVRFPVAAGRAPAEDDRPDLPRADGEGDRQVLACCPGVFAGPEGGWPWSHDPPCLLRPCRSPVDLDFSRDLDLERSGAPQDLRSMSWQAHPHVRALAGWDRELDCAQALTPRRRCPVGWSGIDAATGRAGCRADRAAHGQAGIDER